MTNEDRCPRCKSPLSRRKTHYECGVSADREDSGTETVWCMNQQIQNLLREVSDLHELLAAQPELRINGVKLARDIETGKWPAIGRLFDSVKEAIEATRAPLLETRGRPHKFHSCDELSCTVCNGGLLTCDVCGASEGELPTECPGVCMDLTELRAVYAKQLNFIGGKWVANGEPLVLSADQEREIRGSGQRADDAGRLLAELDATRVQLALARNAS